MLLAGSQVLEEQIVLLLANKPGLEAAEIHSRVMHSASRRLPLLQAVYKELKKLVEQGVVLKVKKTYRLHFNWAIDLISLGNTVARNYLDVPFAYPTLPPGKRKASWKFNDLLRLNDFWTNVVLNLVKNSERRVHLSWNPHPWFHLVQTQQEIQFFNALKHYNVKMYKMVGGRSYFDRWSKRYWDPSVVVCSFAEGPFEKERTTYFSVIDDYITTAQLDQRITNRIEEIYSQAQSAKDIDIAKIIELFRQKVNVKFTIEKNAKKALQIEKKFSRFFGVSF